MKISQFYAGMKEFFLALAFIVFIREYERASLQCWLNFGKVWKPANRFNKEVMFKPGQMKAIDDFWNSR